MQTPFDMHCDVRFVHTRSCWASLFYSNDVGVRRVEPPGFLLPHAFPLLPSPLPILYGLRVLFRRVQYCQGALELGAMAERVLTIWCRERHLVCDLRSS
jgi:hypothetical protein